ncbi:hypothetical protein [Jannaschia marina]|uniref:hypothetical protein n=1 Tax=Jannaschia marina TaxID=2741674 RepID=UPI001F1595F5|nr:hypothetical protein [Jannaschia marina]
MRPMLPLALLTTLLAAPALAQTQANCAPRDMVVERLSGHYGEAFSGGGLQSAETVFEVWVSEADGNWTILMTDAQGVSCIMAAGTDWTPGDLLPQMSGVRS